MLFRSVGSMGSVMWKTESRILVQLVIWGSIADLRFLFCSKSTTTLGFVVVVVFPESLIMFMSVGFGDVTFKT